MNTAKTATYISSNYLFALDEDPRSLPKEVQRKILAAAYLLGKLNGKCDDGNNDGKRDDGIHDDNDNNDNDRDDADEMIDHGHGIFDEYDEERDINDTDSDTTIDYSVSVMQEPVETRIVSDGDECDSDDKEDGMDEPLISEKALSTKQNNSIVKTSSRGIFTDKLSRKKMEFYQIDNEGKVDFHQVQVQVDPFAENNSEFTSLTPTIMPYSIPSPKPKLVKTPSRIFTKLSKKKIEFQPIENEENMLDSSALLTQGIPSEDNEYKKKSSRKFLQRLTLLSSMRRRKNKKSSSFSSSFSSSSSIASTKKYRHRHYKFHEPMKQYYQFQELGSSDCSSTPETEPETETETETLIPFALDLSIISQSSFGSSNDIVVIPPTATGTTSVSTTSSTTSDGYYFNHVDQINPFSFEVPRFVSNEKQGKKQQQLKQRILEEEWNFFPTSQ